MRKEICCCQSVFSTFLAEDVAISNLDSVCLLARILRPLNLETLGIWSWKRQNLEIDLYLYFPELCKRRWSFFGVEHKKNI